MYDRGTGKTRLYSCCFIEIVTKWLCGFFKTNKRFAQNDKPLTCMKQGNVSLTTKKLQSNKTVDAGEQLFQTSTCTSINFICFKIKESVLLLTISTNSDHYSRI